jgi:serine/threonine protein kinase
MALSLNELNAFRDRLSACQTVQDLLKLPESKGRSKAKARLLLLQLVHPDLYATDPPAATLADELFKFIGQLFEGEEATLPNLSSGSSVLLGNTGEYELLEQIATGAIAAVYRGVRRNGPQSGEKVCVKIAHQVEDNLLLQNEAAILGSLDHHAFPKFIDGFETKQGTRANVIEFIDGIDLLALRDLPKYRLGVRDRFHLGWFLERGLAGLGHLHERMIVHGAVEPGNILIVPESHRVVLIDHSFAIREPKAKEFLKLVTPTYSAPEVEDRAPAHPTMDLYGLGMSALLFVGGDPELKSIPDDIDPRFIRLLQSLTQADPKHRAKDAYELAGRVVNIRRQIWDTPGFVAMPLTGK